MAPDSASSCVFCDVENERARSPSSFGPLPTSQSRGDPSLEIPCTKIQEVQSKILYGSADSLESWQIRLLELQPRAGRGLLVGRLFNADILSDKEGAVESGTKNRYDFTAVSYWWGEDQSPRYHLECNGMDYPIPLEAYRALHRIRHRVNPVYVWMDSICINQHDVEEKSKQVARMRSVYQNARQVVVYLGEYPKPSQHLRGIAKTSTEFVFNLLEDHDHWTHGRTSKYGITTSESLRQSAVSGNTLCNPHAELLQSGVAEISQRRWLNRVWVKQEVWAARSIEILYGHSTLSWRALKAMRAFFEDLLFPVLEAHQEPALMTLVQDLNRKLDGLDIGTPVAHVAANEDDRPNPQLLDDKEPHRDIINVLRKAEGAECSNIRDRIYGLLGLTWTNVGQVDDHREKCFLVKYDEHPAETFMRLARYIITRDNSLNILLLSSAFPRSDGSGQVCDEHSSYDKYREPENLPSWVPDWRLPLGYIDPYPLMTPTWWSSVQNQRTYIESERHKLSTEGHIVGYVSPCFTRQLASNTWVWWTHHLPENYSLSCAPSPTSRDGVDLLALIRGVEAPVIIRGTHVQHEYHHIGPLFTWGSEWMQSGDPLFFALEGFMEALKENPGEDCEIIELV